MNEIKIPSIEFVRLKKGMTDSELNDYIAENDDYSFLVYLRYKYDFEEEWTYSTECAAWNACEDCVSWLNDWYEGQQNVEYLAISKFEEEYVGRMFDSQLNSMMKDLVEVLHDLEWWQSCDCDEKRYREKVTKFKKKWFKQTKIDVQKQIESEFEQTKNQLLKEFEYLKDDEK